MISNLCYLGIYENAINDAIESSEELLKLFGFGVSDVVEMNEWARDYLVENGSFESITNSIICAYFSSAKAYVENVYKEVEIDFYVNGHDSHLYYDGTEV
jgi:hypothetical protein